jgi:dephospho-CoA kinase
MLVLGITGLNCAGKDAVADVLVRRGFQRLSLSDALREELRSRGRTVTREALIEVGNELRRREGPAALAERMKRSLRGERVVLVSVRNLAEVAALRALPRFVLLAVEAPPEVRFGRERARDAGRREGTTPTLAAFLALEARENGSDPAQQQLGATIAAADHTIVNDETLEDLERAVLACLEAIDA